MGFMEPLFWRAAFENTMRKRTTYTTLTLELRTSLSSASTVAITHVYRLLYQKFDAHMAYMHTMVAIIETMSEASERIKAYSYIAPYAARDGDMLSVWEHLFSHTVRR